MLNHECGVLYRFYCFLHHSRYNFADRMCSTRQHRSLAVLTLIFTSIEKLLQQDNFLHALTCMSAAIWWPIETTVRLNKSEKFTQLAKALNLLYNILREQLISGRKCPTRKHSQKSESRAECIRGCLDMTNYWEHFCSAHIYSHIEVRTFWNTFLSVPIKKSFQLAF